MGAKIAGVVYTQLQTLYNGIKKCEFFATQDKMSGYRLVLVLFPIEQKLWYLSSSSTIPNKSI